MKVISFVNMKGGVAKTTLAVNVADCISRRHNKKVLLIDVDPQFNATQCLLNGDFYKAHIDNKGHTIIDLFDDTPKTTVSSVSGGSEKSPINKDEIKPIVITDNLHLIPGALNLYRLEMNGGQGRELRLKNYIQHLNDMIAYDYVIIDTPPTPSAWMSSALIASTHYLVPVKPEPLSATGIDLLQSVINRITSNYNLNLSCAGVVFTIVEGNTLVYRQAKKYIDNNSHWKGKRFNSSLSKRTEIARNQGAQTLILDGTIPDSKMQISQIAAELLNRIG